jgi:hypothetical protein
MCKGGLMMFVRKTVPAHISLLVALGLSVFCVIPAERVAAQGTAQAYFRIVQAMPMATDIDVYSDGAKTLSTLMFGTVSQYLPIAAGAHAIAVTAVGKAIGAAIVTQSLTFTAGTSYTLAAIGNTSPAVKPELLSFTDDDTAVPNQAKIRVYHFSDNAGPVSVGKADGTILVPKLDFQQDTSYLMVPPGTYTFQVTLLNSGTKVTQPVTAEADKITTVIGLGEVGGSGGTVFKFITQTENGVPSGMPQTGLAPTAPADIPLSGWAAIAASACLLLSGIGQKLMRRQVVAR